MAKVRNTVNRVILFGFTYAEAIKAGTGAGADDDVDDYEDVAEDDGV